MLINGDLRHLAWGIDPPTMMRSCGLTPDPWQEALLYSKENRIMMCCARQTGKSTATAILALHRALFAPDSLILLLSPSLRQSTELFRKVHAFYTMLGAPVPAVRETQSALELTNGSRVVSLPGSEPDSIRGFSRVGLLIIDEAAMTTDELWIATNPMLAIGKGRLVCLSTPLGQRGWFYDLWSRSPENWRQIKVQATDCPRIDHAFLDEQRMMLGERWYSQEYLCSFEETLGQVFDEASIQRTFDDELEPLFGESDSVVFGRM